MSSCAKASQLEPSVVVHELKGILFGTLMYEVNKLMGNSILTLFAQTHIEGNSRVPTIESKPL